MTEAATVVPVPPDLTLLEIKRLIRARRKPQTLSSSCSIVDIGNNLVVKFGEDVCSSEVEAMKYISDHTPVRVPHVIAYYNEIQPRQPFMRKGFILMTKLPGKTLRNLLEGLNADQIAIVAADLREVVSELGRLNEPGRWGMIGKGGAFHSPYFGGAPCAPRSSSPMADLKAHLLASMNQFDRKPFIDGGAFTNLIDHTFKECDSAFSHGDLRPDNILVDPETCHITGVVNWAYAGWYPCSWDNFVALNSERAYGLEEGNNWLEIYPRAVEMHNDEAIGFYLLLNQVVECLQPASAFARCECCDRDE
ncbi:kinase-like protein [Peniophora sp. CONT]|nr:kinase-like protein [Peniophora sp. CONT]